MKLNKRKCKICKKVFQKIQPLQFVCSPKCAMEYANRKRKTSWRKEKKERLEKLKTLSDYKSECQKVFNEWVRLRDRDLPCISCGTEKPDIKYDAGHFYSIGAYPNLRFNEDNVHKQCSNNCNVHLSGNPQAYREGLIERIGQERFDLLEKAKNFELKLSKQQIIEKKAYYQKLVKEIKKNMQ